MRSVENARVALDDGRVDVAVKMMKSTDALCSRVVAPPTVHGLALRILADAYLQKAVEENAGEGTSGTPDTTDEKEEETAADGEKGGDGGEEGLSYRELAKGALQKGIDVCKVHDGRAGMPPFMVADLAGRMGDLYCALGEIFREEKQYKDALKALRMGVARFEKIGANEFVGASLNRVAFCYMEKEQYSEALSELASAERAATSSESESAILSTTFAYKGKCYVALNKVDAARQAFESALKYGMASGNVGVVHEAEDYLAETQAHSTIDDSAFL